MYTSFHFPERERERKKEVEGKNWYKTKCIFNSKKFSKREINIYQVPTYLTGYTQVIGYVNKQWGEKLPAKFVEMDVIEIC